MALDLEELKQESARLENTNTGSFLDNFFRMDEGEGVWNIRILPPAPGKKLFCLTRTHRLNDKNIHCPKTLVNGKWQGFCPICNYYSQLWKDSDNASGEQVERLQNQARMIKPLEKAYYNIIVRQYKNSKNGEIEINKGPLIWSVGKTLHARILRAILGCPELQEDPLGDITDPQSGRDFKLVKRLKKSGKESYPNYDDSKFLNVSPLGTDKQIEEWMGKLHDLQALRFLKSSEELQRDLNIYRGIEDGEKEESVAIKVEEKAAPLPLKKPVYQADESLIDDDFLAELKNM